MNDPLSTASEEQLAEWAFGRQGVVTDRELAEAALRELARRAAAKNDTTDAAEAESSPAADPPSRARVTRTVVLLAASIVLAAIVAIVLLVVLLRPPSSLAIFDREPSTAEISLSALMNEQVLGGDADARILAESPTATVVGFRTDSLSSEPSGSVCVAVVESAETSDAACMGLDEFSVDGMEVTLSGQTGLFAIDWGPEGDAQVRLPDDFDVGPSGG